MSRFNLSLVFEQPSATQLNPLAKDLNGWTVEDWFNDGFMGWDPENCTFFLHLETTVSTDGEDSADVLAWNFGQHGGDLKTPFEVQAILGALFNVDAAVAFPFKSGMVLRLVDERDRVFEDDPAVVNALRAIDERFALARSTPAPSPAWMNWLNVHAKAGVKASERFVEPTA
ncbi:hypothetical protein [Paraburkholderia sp. C35]|uniref:hypothetical protein n=1 Tax=Paraburkholderia sp. C35 TaxID=2126993 RepID=UPI000D69E6E5|nr:hypothetical protein [Paraburkholderia sp. C35]